MSCARRRKGRVSHATWLRRTTGLVAYNGVATYQVQLGTAISTLSLTLITPKFHFHRFLALPPVAASLSPPVLNSLRKLFRRPLGLTCPATSGKLPLEAILASAAGSSVGCGSP